MRPRDCSIGGQELSYVEVKAIAPGNQAVLTLVEADAELQRLNLLKKTVPADATAEPTDQRISFQEYVAMHRKRNSLEPSRPQDF